MAGGVLKKFSTAGRRVEIFRSHVSRMTLPARLLAVIPLLPALALAHVSRTSVVAVSPTLQSRTLASANPALKNSFNAARTRNQLEAMNVFSETAMRIVGDVYVKYDQAVLTANQKLLQAKAGGNATAITNNR